MKVYIQIAQDYNYTVIHIEAKTSWSKDPEILAKKSTHSVGYEILKDKVSIIKCLVIYLSITPLLYFSIRLSF